MIWDDDCEKNNHENKVNKSDQPWNVAVTTNQTEEATMNNYT